MKPFFLFAILIISVNTFCQYIWPVKDSSVGEGIIYKPQDLIGDELNYDNLIIEASLGAEVVAPESGIIKYVTYVYFYNLEYIWMYHINYNDTISISDNDLIQRKFIASQMHIDSKFVSLSIYVQTKDKKSYLISGIRPVRHLKTGSYLNKGDVIGEVGYFYSKINKPSIMFSISKESRPFDPMSIFGIPSTFIPPQNSKNKINYITYRHTPKELQNDYKIFCESLIEGHPGLYDYTTKEELNKEMNKIKAELDKPLTSEEFRLKLSKIIALIKDSHTAIYSNRYKLTDGTKPPVLFGLKNDSLVIYSTINKYNNYLGKQIIAIDNISVDSLTKQIETVLYRNDGFIQTGKARKLLVDYYKYYGAMHLKHRNDTIRLKFSDGLVSDFIYDNYKKNDYYPLLKEPFGDSIKVVTKIVAPEIAYIKINDFILNDLERIKIRNFIRNISDSAYKGLIIDVRDNLGGEDEIYPYIAQKPWKESVLQKVNKKGTYDLFKNSVNIYPKTKMFQNYIKSDINNSYIMPEDSMPENYPCSINFKGKVVVLVNEYSLSAATLVPALVHKYKRGVIIGRETGSCYYRMNAIKFAKILLKNTGLELYMPLIQVVFDEKENSDIPWGRGVIPDITIPLSYDELLGNNEQYINVAIDVINKASFSIFNKVSITVLLLMLFAMIIFFTKRKR